MTGDITPTALAANTNNWAPTDLPIASTIRASASAAVDLTGLDGGFDGRLIVLHNVGTFTITLRDQSASSTAANRFIAAGADLALAAGRAVLLQYDATASRWRAVNPGGGGTTDHAALASNLAWPTSGHTGTAKGLPNFSGAGAAQTLAPPAADLTDYVLGWTSSTTMGWVVRAIVAFAIPAGHFDETAVLSFASTPANAVASNGTIGGP